ncbi:GNAT family N-acetyltransferase [Photobacterium atrarenae]|uniref:GNAT family N-acetyltransferase n=1 Tax=Photobacterium atrarenae TaxID=865757 RepID=A0ABY5GPT8_9GAMM|nr:GNAT family N-acetyltransferase [Photobacterium atrarenae]UTV30835.1 GNAT family N-acetyltransferase [Photobacterium atrarenae]
MMEPIAFKTKRLQAATLDRAQPGLDQELRTLFTDSVSRYLPPDCSQLETQDDVAQWLDRRLSIGTIVRITLADQVAGYLFVFPEGTAQYRIGYVIAEPCWGQGLATEAMQGLINHLADTGGRTRFIAGIDPVNTASQKVLEKLGFGYDHTQAEIDYYVLETNQ